MGLGLAMGWGADGWRDGWRSADGAGIVGVQEKRSDVRTWVSWKGGNGSCMATMMDRGSAMRTRGGRMSGEVMRLDHHPYMPSDVRRRVRRCRCMGGRHWVDVWGPWGSTLQAPIFVRPCPAPWTDVDRREAAGPSGRARRSMLQTLTSTGATSGGARTNASLRPTCSPSYGRLPRGVMSAPLSIGEGHGGPACNCNCRRSGG